jgi:hypothetical protein
MTALLGGCASGHSATHCFPGHDPREPTDMNAQRSRRPRIVWMSAWFAIAALAWQTTRTAARTRRLERLTHAWLVAGSPAANADQHHLDRITQG